MRRVRQSRPNTRFTGTHFSDSFSEWLKGFTKRKRATRDVTRMSNEVLNYRLELFPIRSVPVADNPGYVRHNRDFFTVQFANGKVNKDLTLFFSEEGEDRELVSYGSAHELGGFFELAFHGLLVDGIGTYVVEWERIKINNRYYTLPVGFHWVNPATVHIDERSNGKYLIQKFSLISKLTTSYYEYRDHVFKKDESLLFKYPTIPCSPVAQSLKYLRSLTQGMDFGLLQGQANIEPENYSLELEKTRYRSASTYWRNQNMTRVKVRRIFNQPIGGLGVSVTTFYEVYAYAEYKKHLNTMRDYFVSQFNNQIMERVQKKNGFAKPLYLAYQGFASNELIEEAFSEYSRGEIDVNAFLKKIKDNYNTDAF